MTGPQQFSLASKLGALAINEMIFLPDNEPDGGPTLMERNVQTAMARAPSLAGRRFTTKRMVAISTGPMTAEVVIAITRTE